MKNNKLFCFLVILSFCLASCSRESKINGEVFVVTKGAGNYKLGAVQVKFYKKSRIDEIKANNQKPAYDYLKSDAEVSTNADGKFTVNLPRGEYMVIAKAQRSVFDGNEDYSWDFAFNADDAEKTLLLNNQNMAEE